MALEVTKVITVNAAGEPTRSFRGGDEIGFSVDFTVTDVPAGTGVRVVFYAMRQMNATVGTGDDLRFVYVPIHGLHWEFRVEPGDWWAWNAWTLPDTDPFPQGLRLRDWERIIMRDHWVMADWPGLWSVTALVTFIDPPRRGQFDHSRERWLYNISY